MSNAAEEELRRAAEELNHVMDNGMDDLNKHTGHMKKELEKLSHLEKAAWKETDRRSAPAAASAKRYAAPAAASAFKATKKVIARTEGELEDVAKDVSSSPTQPPVFHDPTLSLHERDHATEDGKAQGDASERKTQNGTQNEMTANVESFLEEFKNPDFDRDDSNAVIRKANELGLQTIKYADLIERQVLGSGASGTVYHGKWRGTDVAIKQIKIVGKSLEQEDLRKMFWNEVRMLAQLHHPNVVAFYGVVTDGPVGTLATVTEYMVNGSLNQVFQNETYREIVKRKRLKILKDAVCGMEYLHSKNIVHFDLKCENLFVDMRNPKQPICKIGDFGLSKIRQKTLVSGDVRGTLPWIAPELFSGKKVSAKVDVFSFGIVMWELLTGEEPYANMHPGAIMGGVVNNTLRPPIPHDCDPAWRLLMERCWSEDPSARPTFTEIRNEITNLLLSMASSLPLKRQGHHGHVPQHLQN